MIPTALFDYLRRPHEVRWVKGRLQSQVWRGIPWLHELIVSSPELSSVIPLGSGEEGVLNSSPREGEESTRPAATEGVGHFEETTLTRFASSPRLHRGRPTSPCKQGEVAHDLPSPWGGGGFEGVSASEKTGAGSVPSPELSPVHHLGSGGEGDICLLYVTGGDSNSVDLNWAQQLADETGVPVATLFHIPNQPLWDLWEDDLIAHTFDQYVETGEEDWPLLFPMVQSVVAAMDALQERGFTRFIVHGASKRGWTSWLAGIIGDERVIAIAPEVFDNLNMPAQMAQQLSYWGTYSPMIEPYVSEDLPQRLSDPKVLELARIVDPYTYLSLLKVPVYIIQGTNDPFWTVDSLRLYWDAIPGPKWVDYAPGCGHCIGSRDHASRGLPGFVRFVAGTGAAPSQDGESETWWAWSADRHFENSEWHCGEPPQELGFIASFRRWDAQGAICCSPMKLQELS